LFANPSDETLAAIAALHDEQLAALSSEADILAHSIEYGEALADAMLDWMAGDRMTEILAQPPYTPPAGAPELWTSDEPAVEPYRGSLRTFILEHPEVCAQPLTLIFSIEATSTLYLQAQEVVSLSENLSAAQTAAVEAWRDEPASHWMGIMNALPGQLGLKLDRTLEMYAMTTFIMADVYTSIWTQKFNTLLLRPDAYVRQYIEPGWQPPYPVPAYPDYPSELPAVSTAAAETLTRLFGPVAFTYEGRAYTSFHSAAYESAFTPLYAGTDFRVSVENGLAQGRCVLEDAFRQVRLNPVRQGE
jgi:hypothetical protein